MNETRGSGKRRTARRRAGRPTSEDSAQVDERILESAARVFLKHGFARATMEEIATRAGITKQTVYARFSSKKVLFSALASRFSKIVFRPEQVENISKGSPRAFLMEFGSEVMEVLRDAKPQQLFVVLAAEARAFPELASETWVQGPGRLRVCLRQFLDDQIALGRMSIPDPDCAVEQFLGLLVGPLIGRLLFARPTYFDSEERAASYIESAVDLFLAGYLTDAGRQACAERAGGLARSASEGEPSRDRLPR
ncbi:TetR/AcrR family transcriptional regulator [Acidobacteria bacterium AB60]|nr:TetR/AcrR family transcriptional regulator [Acidobacteria bacterium AB60]